MWLSPLSKLNFGRSQEDPCLMQPERGGKLRAAAAPARLWCGFWWQVTFTKQSER